MSPALSPVLRPLTLDDVAELTRVRREQRAFTAPFEPARDDDFFEPERQREVVQRDLDEQAAGRLATFVIAADDGSLAGTLNLNGIVRGAFRSASVGYWVRSDLNGRGLATRAVREAVVHAFEVLELHRVQAEVLPHNAASRRVLAKSGFVEVGLAPRYLRIAGTWQDHLLLQRLVDDPPVTPPAWGAAGSS